MYIPHYFRLEEVLPETFFKTHRELGKALWMMFDQRLLWTADAIRERYGPATVNDWAWGGIFQHRGWRQFDCGVGAELSQHKFGRALDMTFREVPAERVRDDIIAEPFSWWAKHITRVEMGVPWLHFDMGNFDKEGKGTVGEVLR